VLEGAFIVESLRAGTTLAGIPLVVTRIDRQAVEGPASGQPPVWTLLDFQTDDEHADALADALAGALDKPGWWADFRSERETFVVFPERVFRYPRGDATGRSEAQRYGRGVAGVAEHQLDWTI
jgi:hypothetical protein